MYLYFSLSFFSFVRPLYKRIMKRTGVIIIGLIFLFFPLLSRAQDRNIFPTMAPQDSFRQQLRLRTNVLPWLIAVPNLGAEYVMGNKWSAVLDVFYCPWNITDRYALKTVAIFPEARWWVHRNNKGSFFNIHLNIAWFNAKVNDYRYQDQSRPLLGAGIGYGYRVRFNERWGFEFEIGAGMANTKYDRFYNVPNGALKDTRVTTYWGIDRLSIAFTYHLLDL